MEAPALGDLDCVLSDRDRRLAIAESKEKDKDLFTRQRDMDYLDIPAFLRNQAD